jgi:hypothetical protein
MSGDWMMLKTKENTMAMCHECKGRGITDDGCVCHVCKGAGTNGIDLSIDKGRDRILREVNPPPCCARIGNGVWCTRIDVHGDGEHRNDSVQGVYGPLEVTPPLWRKHRGLQEPAVPQTTTTTTTATCARCDHVIPSELIV